MSERTALYRLFTFDDVLFYIGIAKKIGHRWDQHARVQVWWPQIQRQTVEWYPDRETAASAEVTAILTEHPRYNVLNNRDPETGLPVIGKIVGNGDWRETGRVGLTRARTDLSHIVDEVRHKRSCVFLAARWAPVATIVPVDLGEAIKAAGGPDAVLNFLLATQTPDTVNTPIAGNP